MKPRIALLGLGEAGYAFAAGLAPHAHVTGFDPAWSDRPLGFTATADAGDRPPGSTPAGGAASLPSRSTPTDGLGDRPPGSTPAGGAADRPVDFISADGPPGFTLAGGAVAAVAGAQVVIALTAAADAPGALRSALGHTAGGAIYLDLSTGSPGLKRELAAEAAANGLIFAEGVLMAPVLRLGEKTPVLAAGPGAGRAAKVLTAAGMDITPLGPDVGAAAARKLLRSIVVKGVTALMVESLRVAESQGLGRWCHDHLVETLTELDGDVIRRLLDGTELHSVRRVAEMEAAAEMAAAAGEPGAMALATAEVLKSVPARGVPRP